jgi:hypothetical protein
MVIEVSYQAPADSKQGRSRRSKYFEVSDVPPRQTVLRRLRVLAVDFDEDTLSIEARHEDVKIPLCAIHGGPIQGIDISRGPTI